MSLLALAQQTIGELSSGAYFDRLCHKPRPHQRRQAPLISFHREYAECRAQQTFVIPAFEHAGCIDRCIAGIVKNIKLPSNIILIDDASTDDTLQAIIRALSELRDGKLVGALVLSNPAPIYETACDNLGFRIARTEVIIEVQADIAIEEPGFDLSFARALQRDPKPAAISGRCGHAFDILPVKLRSRQHSFLRRVAKRFRRSAMIGLAGERVDGGDISNWRGKIFECETVNRGPWLVLKSDLERHGYLDEANFFLGNDDHDYHRRLYQAEGRRPLYVPIQMSAPLAFGACRRERSGVNRFVYEELSATRRGSSEYWDFLSRAVSFRPIRLLSDAGAPQIRRPRKST